MWEYAKDKFNKPDATIADFFANMEDYPMPMKMYLKNMQVYDLVGTSYNPYPFFKNGAKSLDLRCVLHPAPSVPGCKTRLKSKFIYFYWGSFMIRFSQAPATRPGNTSRPSSTSCRPSSKQS